MVKQDYYQVLGIDRNADEAEIRKAYKRRALKYHPDRNPGDPKAQDRMKEINEAYAVLVDPVKRQRYDRYGHKGLDGYTLDDIFSGVDFGSIFSELGLRDLFGGFFGGFGKRSMFDDFFGRDNFFGPQAKVGKLRARRGADLQYNLEIEIEDAFFGREKKITLPKTEICKACQGTGAAKGGLSICKECKGKGQIVYEQKSGWNVFRQITTCPTCHGQGKLISSPCKECQGKGKVELQKEISVNIPKGASSGQTIVIKGEGEAGEDGGIAGDLYIELNIKDHPMFKKKGDDIYVTKKVTITQALLGGKIYGIPSLNGSLAIEIPEGTEDGAILKIEGKGMPNSQGRGDEYVIVKVAIPKNISQDEKVLLCEFERLRRQELDPLFLSQPPFSFPALPQANKRDNLE
jgi:molecular chaperone DnaJ